MNTASTQQLTADPRAVIDDADALLRQTDRPQISAETRSSSSIMNDRSGVLALSLRVATALSAAAGGSGSSARPGRSFGRAFLCAVAMSLIGCSSLLPTAELATEAPWRSFDEARRSFDSIKPAKTTTADLKAMGIDPFAQDNITILNYADLVRRFAVPGSNSLAALDVGLRQCIEATLNCQGYEIEQRETHHDRTGNFWLDFLNFRRIVRTTGWRFTATLVMNRDLVVYTLWSGQPSIREVEDQRNPLGPAQGVGLSTLQLWR